MDEATEEPRAAGERGTEFLLCNLATPAYAPPRPCKGPLLYYMKIRLIVATALACGGDDAPSNMQWQSLAEGKAKDKGERKGCKVGSTVDHAYFRTSAHSGSGSSPTAANNEYYSGSRGGCFTYSMSGNKRYVAHSFCGN